MAEKQIPQMSDDFLHLCRAISIGENLELCQRRWSGVCAALKGITREDVEAVIRVVFRSKQSADKEALGRIRQHFKSADESFPISGNDVELEAMCAAILLDLFEKKENIASLAALAVTTAAMGGCRQPAVNLDLIGRAEESLSGNARSARQRPDLRELASSTMPKPNFADVVKKVETQPDFNGVKAAFDAAAAAIEGSLKILHSQISKAVSEVSRFVAIQDEELQMLWWLISRRSWGLNRSFSEILPDAQPLVFAKELADFTTVCPGPESILGLLSHAGVREERKLTVAEAINSCDQQWLIALVEGKSASAVTLPIHFAIIRKMETGDNESWIQGWAGAANLSSAQKLPALTLGELFYRERLQIGYPKE